MLGEGICPRIRTRNEKRITCEYNFLVSVLRIIADTILGVTWCMHRFYRDSLADLERLLVLRRLRHLGAISTTDYGSARKCVELIEAQE